MSPEVAQSMILFYRFRYCNAKLSTLKMADITNLRHFHQSLSAVIASAIDQWHDVLFISALSSDVLIDAICISLPLTTYDKQYQCMCKLCDRNCRRCCIRLAKVSRGTAENRMNQSKKVFSFGVPIARQKMDIKRIRTPSHKITIQWAIQQSPFYQNPKWKRMPILDSLHFVDRSRKLFWWRMAMMQCRCCYLQRECLPIYWPSSTRTNIRSNICSVIE